MKENISLNKEIGKIIAELRPKPAQISFAIIDLKTKEPEISGYHMDEFIYPASIYKVFIAAEVLRQIDTKILNLFDTVEIKDINTVDTDVRLFPKRNPYKPILNNGDKVTIDYLLNLMLTKSDNTASNTLVDIVGRENINEYIILPNAWQGSDVTRKFLNRLKEEKEYRISKITVSSARHLAELFYKIETNQLVNEWVSNKLKEYMLNWDREGRGGLDLPDFKQYYRKGGWLEVNHYKHNFLGAIKNIITKGHAINRWVGDAGMVIGEKSHYAIALLTLTKSKWPWVNFPIKAFSKKIYELMEKQ